MDTSNNNNNNYNYYYDPNENKSKEEKKAIKRAKRAQKQAQRRERRQGESFGFKLAKVACVAVVFGLVSGSVFAGTERFILKDRGNDSSTQSVEAQTISKSNLLDSTSVSTATTVSDVSDIVDNVMPSIVAVTNLSYTEYRNLFGRTATYENEAAGSGIIISQDDEYIYIATNNHVVEGAETLTITFCDDAAVPATVKGTDASVDLAVVAVKISDIDSDTMSNIQVASVGDSDTLKVGESAVVIGNALGYGQSVTTGIISATERDVTLQNEDGTTITNSLIQTDAAVNPGNSGGALLNINGQVVGIVSAKYSDTAVEGMGYAIPITTAQTIISELINRKEVSAEDASYFGIAGVDISASMSSYYNIPQGVYVSKVASGSGAELADISQKDVITKFNGKSVSSMEEISEQMKYIPAGTTISVTVAKANDDYKETDVKVTLSNKMK
ncbi:MAG: trypsin-like peptidase domain-containing protein [Lachnospiraceae bacterium]|nr:trypsin-like peptidase domain-containing protein [Lachnospiraceae bacterium]